MSESSGHIVLRVRTANERPFSAAFDALILAIDSRNQAQLRPSRLTGIDTPFERELPDIGLTIVLRATAGDVGLVSECDVLNPDGSRRVYGRSRSTLTVFMCSDRGIVVTGLPAPALQSIAPAT